MATCPACTAALHAATRFCPDCGAPLRSEDTPTGTAPHPGPAAGGPRKSPRSSSAPHRTSSTSSSTDGFAPGDLLAERYRIVGLLGRGGMGEVYRADDLKLGQPVALKFLPESVAQDADRLDRFYNEVRIARQVSHPNVCRVHDIAEAAGQHFLSMEFVDGEDLASLLRRIGRLPGNKAVEIARQLCAGLAAAHERGVLHRDLKPENVMIDGRGRVRITDFGLAGVAESIAGGDVRSGTPAYMSPEQLAGREVSSRSDIYALGLVIYELFTGKRAFEGKSFGELMRQHQDQPPRPPSELVPDLDAAVERVIMRCLEKEPRKRPASALAVAAGLGGGDALAAAIAAGETPSPEIVAAAGEEGGLRPGQVWALLAFGILGAIVCMATVAQRGILRLQPIEKPPLVLADRARELINRLGYSAAPADSAYGLGVDYDFLQYTNANDRSPDRWEKLSVGRPPVLQFWYRQSPRILVSTAVSGQVSSGNPPLIVSGMTGVRFDAKGRLIEFYAVPPQIEEPAERVEAPDWAPLFAEAKLERDRFAPVPSRWIPQFASDTRAAWEGSYPERPDIKVRIEAAGYRGHPVLFQLVHPWTRPERMQAFKLTREQLWSNTFVSVVFFAAVVASALLARQNVKAGRSDRRGALRLTVLVFGVLLAAWALGASHVSDFNTELSLIGRGAGSALLHAGILGMLYLALEPYVRRLWPDALISWARLLSGRLADPLVGSHVLMGIAYGVASGLMLVASSVLFRWLGEPPSLPALFNLDALVGVRETAFAVLMRAFLSTAVSLAIALVFVGMRFLLRRKWLAALAMLAIVSLPDALGSGVAPAIAIPVMMVLFSVAAFALVRQGLLSLIVILLVVGLLLNFPLTVDLTQWSALPTLIVGLVMAALCFYSTRGALSIPRQD